MYRKNEHHERGELLVAEASERLEMPTHAVIRLIKNKYLPAKQACKSAPWVIEETAIKSFLRQGRKSVPLTENLKQQTLDLLTT